MQKLLIILAALLLVSAAMYFIFFKKKEESSVAIFTKPKFGNFEVVVSATGELQAQQSIDIRGPDNLRKARIWQLKIQTLLPEGTVVRKGDMVAELDKSELVSKIKEAEIALTKATSQYTQTKLDCTLTLSQAREEIINQRYALEENKLKREQSRFEAPAVIRQVELEYEKALRHLNQSETNYVTKIKQANAKMSEASSELEKQEREHDDLRELAREFTIKAPENGMVIYIKNSEGKKVKEGMNISSWDPNVATLPDLTHMESIAFVNEIDIQKVKVGQSVKISMDADPKKKLSGKVTFKANIGEQKPNSESKVFEVKIAINEQDSTLRPAMTTSNSIVVSSMVNTLSVPLECIHTEGKKTFVYKKNGSQYEKAEVVIGEANDMDVSIKEGVSTKDVLYLNFPTEDSKVNTPSPENNTDSTGNGLSLIFIPVFFSFRKKLTQLF